MSDQGDDNETVATNVTTHISLEDIKELCRSQIYKVNTGCRPG